MDLKRFTVTPGEKFRFSDYDPEYTGDLTKGDAKKKLKADSKKLRKLQNLLYSENKHALLVIIQGLDASGKDGTIDHVFSKVNPAGYHVVGFKAPSTEELDHDYLWRHVKELPRRGEIVIFNRSHYEEVAVVRVHPEFLDKQHLPASLKSQKIWKRRFEEIRNFEKFLVNNGIIVLKFYLNASKKERARRLLEREKKPSKRDKFSLSDAKEMKCQSQYTMAYQSAIANTSTPWAKWHVVPADHKWFARAVIAQAIVKELESLELHYSRPTREQRQEIKLAKRLLKGK